MCFSAFGMLAFLFLFFCFLFCSVKSNLPLFSIRVIKPSKPFLIIGVCFLLQSSALCIFFVFAFFFPLSDLIHCTNEMNVNIPQLADTLFERTANSSWVVVFKALITTHHLMMYGNEVGGSHTHSHKPSRAIDGGCINKLYCYATMSHVHKYKHALCRHFDKLFMSISPFGSKVVVGRPTNAYGIQTVCAATEDLHIGHMNE